MSHVDVKDEAALEKLRSLPSGKGAEILDVFDFLLMMREEESKLIRGAAKLSETSFAKVWDNPEDSVYDDRV